MRVVPTVGTSIWYGSDRYPNAHDRNTDDRAADDRNADDCNADILALAEPDDGSHATAGSGYAHGMGVSTSCVRHVHWHAARAAQRICLYTVYMRGHSQGTPRLLTGYCSENSRGSRYGRHRRGAD